MPSQDCVSDRKVWEMQLPNNRNRNSNATGTCDPRRPNYRARFSLSSAPLNECLLQSVYRESACHEIAM